MILELTFRIVEGWIVTFIIRERDGGPSAGYISSGFFGGLTLGRVALIWFNRRASASITQSKACFLTFYMAGRNTKSHLSLRSFSYGVSLDCAKVIFAKIHKLTTRKGSKSLCG